MNCTTTRSTEPCRGSDEYPCRRPAHRQISYKEPFHEETDPVWTEAGFLPPADCRRAVALLHRLAMDDEPAASLLSCVLAAAAKAGDTERSCRIFDPARLRRVAEEYGIELAGRSDDEVARAVTLAIIGEYEANMPEEHA